MFYDFNFFGIFLKRFLCAGFLQSAIHAAGLIAGIVVIRFVGTDQYAYYTIACSVLGTMATLCDSGGGNAVLALGGVVWRNPEQLGQVYREGLRMRFSLAVICIIVAVPVLAYLLDRQGASLFQVIVMVVAVIPVFISTLTGQLREVCLKLHQKTREIQLIQLIGAAFRLVLLFFGLALIPSAAFAIGLSGVSQIWMTRKLIISSMSVVDTNCSVDLVVRERIWKSVKRSLPQSIYYAFSAQLTVYIVSMYGNSESVAIVGASSRLANILGVIGSVFGLIVVPRFSCYEGLRVLGFYCVSILGVSLACLMLIAPFYFYPLLIDLAMGGAYQNNHSEILLSLCVYAVGLVGNVSFHLASARGFILNPIVSVGVCLFLQIILASFFELSTAMGVLRYSLTFSAFLMVINFLYGFIRLGSR